jgi:photosystem II stability/assembly factor-like uncharacterized protein
MKTRLLIGTRKGGFIAESDDARREWTLAGPILKGNEVNHVSPLGGDRIIVAGKSAWWGPAVQISDDWGRTWRDPQHAIRFDEGRGRSVERIWFVKADPRVAGRVYAGVDPAALFVSNDRGDTWHEIAALTDHPTRAKWFPGAGGLMVHSIVFDRSLPARLTVGISSAGVFRSDDDGRSWAPKNNGLRADFLPAWAGAPAVKFPDVGQCVHHMEMHPQQSHVIYQQNHCGVYRSDDGGDAWNDISRGLPTWFGFALAVLPHDGDTIFVIPEEGSEARMTADARLGVYRSQNRGASWQLLTNGLPQSNAYVNVMRMAMSTDAHEAPGVYVGTQGGQILASRDGGDSWNVILNWLPPVYSIETVIV